MCIHEKVSSPEFKALASKFAAIGMIAITYSDPDPRDRTQSIADYSVFAAKDADAIGRAAADLQRWHPNAKISEQTCLRVHRAGISYGTLFTAIDTYKHRKEDSFPSFEFDELTFEEMVAAFASYGYIHAPTRSAMTLFDRLAEFLGYDRAVKMGFGGETTDRVLAKLYGPKVTPVEQPKPEPKPADKMVWPGELKTETTTGVEGTNNDPRLRLRDKVRVIPIHVMDGSGARDRSVLVEELSPTQYRANIHNPVTENEKAVAGYGTSDAEAIAQLHRGLYEKQKQGPDVYAGASAEAINLLKRADQEPDLFARLDLLRQVYDKLYDTLPGFMAPIGEELTADPEELTLSPEDKEEIKAFAKEAINEAVQNLKVQFSPEFGALLRRDVAAAVRSAVSPLESRIDIMGVANMNVAVASAETKQEVRHLKEQVKKLRKAVQS